MTGVASMCTCLARQVPLARCSFHASLITTFRVRGVLLGVMHEIRVNEARLPVSNVMDIARANERPFVRLHRNAQGNVVAIANGEIRATAHPCSAS